MQISRAEQRAVAIIAPRDAADGCPLGIELGLQEAQVLERELAGAETSRSQAIALASRIAPVLQAELLAAVLTQCRPGCVRAFIQVRTQDALIEVPTEPGQALSAAVCLRIPLLADRRLLRRADDDLPPIGGAVRQFLESLDLSPLDD
jgi:hypothetical protein